MNPKEYDIAVIGGGFSGLLAADILKDYDLDILLVDEYPRLGGQYLRTHPQHSDEETDLNDLQITACDQIHSLNHERVNIMTRSRVLDISGDGELLVEQDGPKLYRLKPEIIILATGAREKFIPFKGWTLPGILSTGAVQIMLKGSGVIPAENMIIGGSGLFLYTVAADVITHGGRISAIFDENSLGKKIGFLKALIGLGDKLKEGMGQISKILFSRTRMRHQHRIIEARGESALEEVVAAKIDPSGKIVSGTEAVYPCDCLAIGNGFSANIELGLSAGCDSAYSPLKGGWFISVDRNYQTSVPGIYAIGETNGVGGALKSIRDGKCVAYAILRKLGKIDDSQIEEWMKPIEKEEKRHRRFERRFNAMSTTSANAVKSISDDTILCRCEDITVGEVKEAIASGCRTPVAIKRALRTGMGICQGRICSPILYDMLGALTLTPINELKPLTVRGPVKAVPLEVLAKPVEHLHP